MNRLVTIILLCVIIGILIVSRENPSEGFQAPEPILELSDPIESSLVTEQITYSRGPRGPTGAPGNNATPITLKQLLQDFLSRNN